MDEKLVYISHEPSEGAEPALAEPVFIVEHEGKLYVTRAVWEYHAGDDATDAVKKGVDQVRELFETHAAAAPTPPRVAAVPLPPQQLQMFELSKP